ncbi:MAG: hypothetical protein EAX86_07800 [Candidatus Heimdallarchaeota archaeon]|nr:hypothetical protein [Candidatus Heimdallarchaeota archaeon]
MSIDPTYIKSAVETLELIQQLYNHLKKTGKISSKLAEYLTQIESKAVARIGSPLGRNLGMDIPVEDQEGKSPKYWEGVRDMAKLAKKQYLVLKEEQKFISFLNSTNMKLSSQIAPKDTSSPLEDLLQGETEPIEPVEVSPLEEMLSPKATTPKPTFEPISTPKIEPFPEPEPIPVPRPTPPPIKTPKPEIKPEPVIPVLDFPVSTPSLEPPTDKLEALNEALKSSGIEEPVSEPVEPAPSLTKMLLEKDDTSEKEEDDMLSLSLREALKILRDEDED